MKDTRVSSFFRPSLFFMAGLMLLSMNLLQPAPAVAASAAEIARDSRQALQELETHTPKTRDLAAKATAILVFPEIVKAGFLVGGQTGSGALIKQGQIQAYYDITAVSFGLQAGAQTFGYALFFMNDEALQYLDKSDGWAIGAGPSVVVVDQAAAAGMTSTTLTQDVYAVPFGQKGLMAGIGLEGSKITRIHPE